MINLHFYGRGRGRVTFAIVDDRGEDRAYLRELLREYAALNHVSMELREFPSGEALLAAYAPLAYTAVFLDIYMDGMTGMETARALHALDRRAPIVFVSTSMEHMSEAFSLHAHDYIEKGTPKERIFHSLDELLDLHTRLVSAPKLTFGVNRAEISVSYLDLVFVRTAEKNYLEIADADGNRYETRMTFSAVEQLLAADDRFLTLTRGVIVNLDYVEEIGAERCVLTLGASLPLNVRGAKQLRQAWQNYLLRETGREDESRRRKGC